MTHGGVTTSAPWAMAPRNTNSTSSTANDNALTPSPWASHVIPHGTARFEPCGHDQADAALFEDVGAPIPAPGFRAGVRHTRETEAGHEQLGHGAGVADPQLEGVPAEQLPGGSRKGDIDGQSHRV